GLGDLDARAAGEAGQQQRALHLRARARVRVPDRLERAALDLDRQAVRLAELGEARAHAGERLGDAAHGAGAERVVAGEDGAERLTGQQAEQQAGRGAAVAAVQRAGELVERVQAVSGDGDRRAVLRYVRQP